MAGLKQISGPFLLIIPLLLTGTVGVYFNSANNNGLATPTVAQFAGCPTLIVWNNNPGSNAEICQAYNQTFVGPCQSPNNATYCGFQKPSVLNPNSPWTCIFTLSWQCFVNGITGVSNGPTPTPFQFFNQQSPPIFNICINFNSTTPVLTSIIGFSTVLLSCDEIFPTGHKVPANISTEYLGQYNCTNISKVGFGGNYVYFGCDFVPSHALMLPVNNTWSAIEAINATYFGAGSGWDTGCTSDVLHPPVHACDVQASVLIYTKNSTNTTPTSQWKECGPSIAAENSGNTTSTPECKAAYTSAQQENGGSGSDIFFLGQILAMVGGMILILIGFGLGFSGGALTFNFSVTPNSQGTRYAQILGFALLVIVPIDAEFSGPFSILTVMGIGSTLLLLFGLFEFLGIFFMVAEPTAPTG